MNIVRMSSTACVDVALVKALIHGLCQLNSHGIVSAARQVGHKLFLIQLKLLMLQKYCTSKESDAACSEMKY